MRNRQIGGLKQKDVDVPDSSRARLVVLIDPECLTRRGAKWFRESAHKFCMTTKIIFFPVLPLSNVTARMWGWGTIVAEEIAGTLRLKPYFREIQWAGTGYRYRYRYRFILLSHPHVPPIVGPACLKVPSNALHRKSCTVLKYPSLICKLIRSPESNEDQTKSEVLHTRNRD